MLFDLGGLNTTGMHCIVMEKLREFYGLEKKPVTIIEPSQMLGHMVCGSGGLPGGGDGAGLGFQELLWI